MKMRLLVWPLLLVMLLTVSVSCDTLRDVRNLSDEKKLIRFREATESYREGGYIQTGSLTYTRNYRNVGGYDTLVRNETFTFAVLSDKNGVKAYQSVREGTDALTTVGGIHVSDNYRVTEGFDGKNLYYASVLEGEESFCRKSPSEPSDVLTEHAASFSLPLLSPDQFETVSVSPWEEGDGFAVTVKNPLPKTKTQLLRWARGMAMGQGIDLQIEVARGTLYYNAKGIPVSQSIHIRFLGSEGGLKMTLEGEATLASLNKKTVYTPEDADRYEETEGLLTVFRAEEAIAITLTRRDLNCELEADFLLRDAGRNEVLERRQEWNSLRYGLRAGCFRYEIQYDITNSDDRHTTNQKGRISYDGKTQTVIPQKGQGSETDQTEREAEQYMASVLSPLAFDVREISDYKLKYNDDGTTVIVLDFGVPGRAASLFDGMFLEPDRVSVTEAARRLTVTLTEEGAVKEALLELAAHGSVQELRISATNTFSVTDIE